MFRFVTLNTHEQEYLLHKAKFIRKLLDRGYDTRIIRRLQRKCRVVWSKKDVYLKQLHKKYIKKKHAAIINNLHIFESPRFVYARDINLLRRLLLNRRNSDNSHRIYFIKTFNRLLDDDHSLREILTSLVSDLSLLQLEIMIRNRIKQISFS